MIEGIPRISVLMICYKQEELIKRAIDSLLSQKDYIYEICVSDDCSPDRTWEVLQEYEQRYPGLFKLHRNNPNVGIFENNEESWKLPSGDVILQLEGDDACGENYCEKVISFIEQNKIDYKNELFCIYGDYKVIYPNGDSFVGSNVMAARYPDETLSALIHNALSPRSACYSIKILKQFKKVSVGRSYIAEDAQDRQLQLLTEKAYHIPHVGNIYYSRIGVCVHLNHNEHLGRIDIFKYSHDFLKATGKLSKRDAAHLLFKDALLHYEEHKSCKLLLKVWYYQHKGLVFKFDFSKIRIQRICFAIRRRLPHKKQLTMQIG